jgi:Acetyltransferase (GNAT) family
LFLDIRLAKKRLEKVLGPCGVADGTSDGPWLAEPCQTGARLTEPFYAGTKQEPARAVFCGVAIERIRPTVGRSIGARANSSGEDPDAAILVAEAHGDVIGYAYAALQGYDYMSLRGPAGILHDLIVESEHRGRGVAQSRG